MKNKILFVTFLMLVVLSSIALASQEVIEVKLNDKYIDFTDSEGNKVEPTLINDRTMVPMRKIFETLGAEIQWDGALQKVIAKTDEKEISLQIDNMEATLKDLSTEDIKSIKLDAAPVILNDRTMVPVRFIAESLEKQVGWDAENKVVVIIDYADILNDINENCSSIIEMVGEQKVEVNTFDTTIELKGNLNYKDTENSKNNEKITLNGAINIKKGEDKAEIDFNSKITGKGSIYDALKENDYNVISLNTIYDIENGDAYVKSSLLEEKKWIKTSEDMGINIDSFDKTNIEDAIILPENELTKDSYEELKLKVEVCKALFGNDRVTVSGKSIKTYTIKLGLDDILKVLGLLENDSIKELLSLGKAAFEISCTYKDGMLTKGKYTLSIDWQMKDSKERVTANISGDVKINSYNKAVKIELPKASEIESKY